MRLQTPRSPLVPFRVVGLGIRAPEPSRNDGLDILLRLPGAEGVRAQARVWLPRALRGFSCGSA